MPDFDSPRRRDVLRASATVGFAALGWSVRGVSAQDQTTTEQRQRTAYAFSYGLQSGDRFQVLSRVRTPEGDPATERISPECLEDGSREFPAFVVRAYRNTIRLGYEGVFFPPDAVETETTGTTTGETTTVPEQTPRANETTTGATTTGATTTAQAAVQDETTTPPPENQTTTTAEETTVPETTTTEATTTATATTGGTALPAIRVGEWYRVTAMSKCDSLARLSLESAEPPTGSDGD